jgi:two-component system response regulator HydG
MPQAPKHTHRILVVDDHVEMAELLADQLADAGYTVEAVQGGEQAIRSIRERPYDLVITDLRMEGVDGFDVLDFTRKADPTLPVIIMTAFGAIESAIDAMKRGASHYLTKPFRLEEVLLYVERALEERRLREEHRALRRVAEERVRFGALIGRSPKMRALYDLIERVAPSPAPVLIRGESGTGKERVAGALHFQGPRRDRPFIVVNCTALPGALLEREIFGQLDGSKSAPTQRGLLLQADGGTLFLDEIGDVAPDVQDKLLRVIDESEVRAVGSSVSRKVDVRFLAATHKDLEQRVRDGMFRADLFYRLNVVSIVVPPLRERAEDIPLFVASFVESAIAKNPGSPVKRFSPDVVAALARCPWPGNVRELENVIERLVICTAKEVVDFGDLEAHAPGVFGDSSPLAEARQRLIPLRQLETEYIAWVIARCGGNKTRAAEVLGIDVSTIHRRERDKGGAPEPELQSSRRL